MSGKIFNYRKTVWKIYWPLAITFIIALIALIIASLFIKLDLILWGFNALGVTAICLLIFFFILSISLYIFYSNGANYALRNKKVTLEELNKEYGLAEDQIPRKKGDDFDAAFKKIIVDDKQNKDDKSNTDNQ